MGDHIIEHGPKYLAALWAVIIGFFAIAYLEDQRAEKIKIRKDKWSCSKTRIVQNAKSTQTICIEYQRK